VRVYEAGSEAAAMELVAMDARRMAAQGWFVSSRRWSDPDPFAVTGMGRRVPGALATLFRPLRRGREVGCLWIVWRQAGSRSIQPEYSGRKLNPGGYCRRCGRPREVGATACVSCGTGISHARSGSFP
jgi:hypothetical protein